MTRFTNQDSLVAKDIDEERIKRVEEQIRVLQDRQANTFVAGRLRFNRSAPTSSTDVGQSDLVYDIVRDSNYEYVLINTGSAYEWRRISYSSF